MTESDREEAIALARETLQRVRSRYVQPEVEVVEEYRSYLRNDRHGHHSTEGLFSLQLLSERDQLDQDEYDAIAWYGVAFLREGRQPPPWLAEFMEDVLKGKRTRPVKDGRKKKANYGRECAMVMAVERLADKYGLQRYSNTHDDLKEVDTACALVIEAAKKEGLDIRRHTLIQAIRGGRRGKTQPLL